MTSEPQENYMLLDRFTREAKTFAGFTFSGLYDIESGDFMIMYQHYIDTGENLLDRYSDVMYLTWEDSYSSNVMDEEKYLSINSGINHPIIQSLFPARRIEHCRSLSKKQYDRYLMFTSYEMRRARSCIYTSDRSVRNKVFKLHGKKCLSCGSEKLISLDHIVPVALGGEDKIENLQPLCKSCNSKKGTLVIDYRTNVLNHV